MNLKYKSWLTSLDSDNFAMFIKTWFAYLASIHELVNITLSEEERERKIEEERGDKFFLDKYRKDIVNSISLNTIAKVNILEVYDISKQTVKIHYPQFYYQTYYKKIIPFKLFEREVVTINRDDYKFDVKIEDDKILFGLLVESEHTIKRLKKRYITASISLIPNFNTELDTLSDSSLYYNKLKLCIRKALYKNINHIEETKSYNEMKVKVDSLVQLVISKIEGEGLHARLYNKWCDKSTSSENDLKEWFHGFCYYLRNILFHRIIDPFDSDWSTIMKTSYQGLREMLLLNIEKLESTNNRQTQG